MESYFQKFYRQVKDYQQVRENYKKNEVDELERSSRAFVARPEERRTILVNSYYISENKRYLQRRAHSSFNGMKQNITQSNLVHPQFASKQLFITDLQ
ncbi:hypothetical protein SS50377_20579 [Spironucleus salmonicida]|uniref:Uncharacterized protein n=1 Tax=Spironucleus salmonicida TaxID=348837 RepID=V6LVB6_9EUKA|nr:hypothetical protein SS50377_20579 [Spironucleus salmonicida]|eukprot:EST48163.1 Hypothetical protein SS50377_11681 [Spironucleus salmonicida]